MKEKQEKIIVFLGVHTTGSVEFYVLFHKRVFLIFSSKGFSQFNLQNIKKAKCVAVYPASGQIENPVSNFSD